MRLCPTGKFAYAEEGYARKKLAYLACLPDEQRKVRAPTRTYRCPKCGWWHLTSQVHR